MKILVVYYSHTANNEKLASFISKKLSCPILKIEELSRRSGFTILLDVLFKRYSGIKTDVCTLSDFDHVIFIAPIWAAMIAAPMKTFLRKEGPNIPDYSFITVCSGYAGQAQELEKQLISLVGAPAKHLLELWINDLMPAEKKDKIRYVTPYRINDNDLHTFEPKIDKVLSQVKASVITQPVNH